MSQRRFTDEQEREICALYVAGKELSWLGREFGAPFQTIRSALRRNGIERRTYKPPRKFTDEQEAEICRRYKEGENSTQLAAAFDCTCTSILALLKRHKVKSRSIREAKGGLDDETEIEICRRYELGESTVELAKAFGKGDDSKAIYNVLIRRGIQTRSIRIAKGGITPEQEKEACQMYKEGKSTSEIGAIYGVSKNTIGYILETHGIERRSSKIAMGGLEDDKEIEACEAYQDGLTMAEVGAQFGIADVTVCNILKRRGYETRERGTTGDTIQHALTDTGRFDRPRDCEFYLYDLVRYKETHCKPGISFFVDHRAQDPEYGDCHLAILFDSRHGAYFLEQAVLEATKDHQQMPRDLMDWDGSTEIREMHAVEMIDVVLHYNNLLEDLGLWQFAADYVPMTKAQRKQCLKRAASEDKRI